MSRSENCSTPCDNYAMEASHAEHYRFTMELLLEPGISGRLGVIQPAPGLMLEAEWARAMPPGVAFPVTRLTLHGATADDYADMAERAPEAAAILANAGADVIAYACGIGSLYRGPAHERALMDRLSAAAGGIPVIGMAEAALGEIKRVGARRITLLTPYAAPVNALVRAYAEACGMTIAAVASLPVESAIAAAGLRPEQTIAAAAASVAMAPTDLLWIPCSNVRAFDLCDRITSELGCPCISSNRALLTVVLDRLERSRQSADSGQAAG
jgi:maleate isomerase